MRERFPGFFPPTNEELADLLRTAEISFDANSLLNLYRFSEPTRAALIDLIASIEERVWVPEQVVEEVLLNRPNVIAGELKRYEEFRKQLEGLLASLRNPSTHPFVSEELLNTTVSHFGLLHRELRDREEVLERTFTHDPVRDRLAEILSGRIGTYLDNQARTQVLKAGRERYDRKIPPGYKDNEKPEHERFGDLIIWTELQMRARERRTPVIFITDDTKEDWWLEVRGKTIGPRPELTQEFYRETDQRFHLLRTARFMELGREYLGAAITSSAIDEATRVEEEYPVSARRSGSGEGHTPGVERRYAVPKPSRGQLLRALDDFDAYFRTDPAWNPWRGHHKYAIAHSGRLYPVKKIISLAAGIPTDAFSGGSQANRILVKRGFEVVRLRDEPQGHDPLEGVDS